MAEEVSSTSSDSLELDVFGIAQDSIVDGPGLRFAIFVQGCANGCPGCHNPESHQYGCGTKYTVDDLVAMIERNPLVKGVTISGGEPFDQPEACAELAARLRADGYDIWVYTGYLLDDLLTRAQTDEAAKRLLENTNTLVDGPYIEDLASYDLKWRGSSNQRIIENPMPLASQIDQSDA